MAYQDEDEKLRKLGQTQEDGYGSASGSTDTGGYIPSSSAQGIAGAAPGSQPGTGGTKHWTNFQSYLNANQGQTKTTDRLKEMVGGSFDQEKQQLQSQASDTKSKVAEQTAEPFMGMDQASKLAGQAYQANQTRDGAQDLYAPASKPRTDLGATRVDTSGGYPAGTSSQPTQYLKSQSAIDQIVQALGRKYQGPESFNYSVGSQAQDYGGQLASDDGFGTLMDNVYRSAAANNQIGTGGMALQRQLDTGNDALTQARQNLMSQYTGLNDEVAGTNQSLNQQISDAKDLIGSNVDSLRGGLTNLAGTDKSSIQSAADTFNQLEKARANGWVDQDNLGIYDLGTAAGTAIGYTGGQNPWDAGPFNDTAMTPEQWARQQLADTSDYWGVGSARDEFLKNFSGYRAGDTGSLENASGVDYERNQYNAIMEALGLGGNMIGRTNDAQHGKKVYKKG